VIATVSGFLGSQGSAFLDVLFTSAKTEVGAFFGNDQGVGSIQVMKLSVYDAEGVFLGSVNVTPNGNTSVDQFIGLRSTTPFVRARFENIPDSFLSVVLDDVMFNVT